MAGNVGSKGDDSLGDTDETVLIKEYDSKDAAIIKLFFKKELQEILSVGLVKCDPSQGPGLKLLIQSVQKKRARVDPLIKDLDNKLKMIEEREVTVPSDAFAKLSELIRSEEKRQIGAEQKELVLYLPDIVKKIVQVFFWPGNDKAVIKLEAIFENDKDPTRSFGRNVTLDQASCTGDDHDYEPMECLPMQPSAHPRSEAFEKRFSGTFKLLVYKASILHLPVVAIVNAANDNMDHGGGVAKVISEAAGWHLDRECKHYISKLPKGLLPVTRNIVTTGGNLIYRGVIHAVGPHWNDSKYRDDKLYCLDDLYDTIKNVLETCDREGYQTVAMPAISAGMHAVPKKLCADMYVKAAAEYSQIRGSKLPKELHIVDIDDDILDLVKKSVENYIKNPASIDQRKTLPDHLATTFSIETSSTFEGSISRKMPNQEKQDDGYHNHKDTKTPSETHSDVNCVNDQRCVIDSDGARGFARVSATGGARCMFTLDQEKEATHEQICREWPKKRPTVMLTDISKREQCKQIVLTALGLKTWNEVEDSYDQADNMLQYTDDVSTSEGRIHFLTRALELAKMGKTKWTVNITVKRNGEEVPVDKQLIDKHSSQIINEMKKKP